jgi:hypothetical protein
LNLKLLEDVVCAMDMRTPNTPPIACTLAPGDYHARLAWIAELARDALLGFERRELVLELRFALEAADRVREMVRKEQACCGFLTFELEETPREIRLTIRAPEEARGALKVLAVAVAAVAGAWVWVWWQSARSRRRPAPSTLYLMALATVLLVVALLWPLIEAQLRMALRR